MQLYISPINYYNQNQDVSFGAAKDINLRYIWRERRHLLPDRMVKAVDEALTSAGSKASNSELPTLRALHDKTYKGLFGAKTLDEVRENFIEFHDVRDFTEIAGQFSRSARMIQEQGIALEDFSLDCLKKIWSGMPQEEVAKSYGFSCRGVLSKICKNLNIPKPVNNYLTLLKTSCEEGNKEVADKTRRHLELSLEHLALANKANKTPEARAKQAESMRRFYVENPDKREEVGEISSLTWQKCPEVREAQARLLADASPFVQMASRNQLRGRALDDMQRRSVLGFYKNFWHSNFEFREVYGQARKEAAQEIKNKKLQG